MRIGKISGLASASFLAIAIVLTASGCKSATWKMPGSRFFAGKQAPDPATLAGKADDTGTPQSPASKYTPGTIASVGAKSPDASSDAGTNSSTSAYGYTAQSVGTPQAGLAAQANGYQTGPYQTGPYAPNAVSSNPAPQTSLAVGGLPNPYGGTYTGKSGTTTTPNITLPNSVNQALASGNAAGAPMPNIGLPSMTNPQTNIPVGYPSPTGSVNAASATSPPAYSTDVPGLPNYPSLPAVSPSSSTYNPPMPSAYQGTAMPSFPAADSSPATTPSKTYSPGTTGRNTTYDFSGAMKSNSNPLPPNTASGANPLLR